MPQTHITVAQLVFKCYLCVNHSVQMQYIICCGLFNSSSTSQSPSCLLFNFSSFERSHFNLLTVLHKASEAPSDFVQGFLSICKYALTQVCSRSTSPGVPRLCPDGNHMPVPFPNTTVFLSVRYPGRLDKGEAAPTARTA